MSSCRRFCCAHRPGGRCQWPLGSLALGPSQAPPSPRSTSSNSEATGQACVERAGLLGCQTAGTSVLGEPQPVMPADTARGPALLVTLCFLCRSQCHLIRNGTVLHCISSAKDAIPVLCTEPLGGGRFSLTCTPLLLCATGPS